MKHSGFNFGAGLVGLGLAVGSYARVGTLGECLGAIKPAQISAKVAATILLDPGKLLATMPTNGLGLGVAVWDRYMTSAPMPGAIKQAGFHILRYPGGSYSDIYYWATNSGTDGMHVTIAPNTDFDHFMALCNAAGSTPLITVNYGSNQAGTGGGDPAEAAAWVKYANVTHHWNVKYWEIGNEVYGNGYYNNQGWETDLHDPNAAKNHTELHNPLLSPMAYGNNLNAYIQAMKAVDPTIQIGAVITTPGGWPDGVSPNWAQNVLQEAGKNIDFVVIHYYPSGPAAQMLMAPQSMPGIVSKVRQEVNAYCGSNASHVQIWVTEGDGSGQNIHPAGALYAADEMGAWLSSGVANVDWWDQHNGVGPDPNSGFDDQGIFSNASSSGSFHEPAVNTPFPPYYGIELFHDFAQPGDQFFGAHSSDPLVRVYAVNKGKGRFAVMLINESPTEAKTVRIALTKAQLAKPALLLQYPPNGPIKSAALHLHGGLLRLPAYSVNVVIIGGKA